MKNTKAYEIVFSGLSQGEHTFEYEIKQDFFEHFDYHEFENADLKVTLHLAKGSTLMDLDFSCKGTVGVCCDVTGEPFEEPLEAELKLVVKFGEQYNDDDEQILVLPHGEYQMNVAQYIYEMIVLSLPSKHYHPDYLAGGETGAEMAKKLRELSPKSADDDLQEKDGSKDKKNNNDKDDTDPRWSQLRNLLTD